MMCDAKRYNAAVEVCDVATQRLQCLNKKLEAQPSGTSLTKKTRDKLRQYYDDHLEKCEGIILPIN